MFGCFNTSFSQSALHPLLKNKGHSKKTEQTNERILAYFLISCEKLKTGVVWRSKGWHSGWCHLFGINARLIGVFVEMECCTFVLFVLCSILELMSLLIHNTQLLLLLLLLLLFMLLLVKFYGIMLRLWYIGCGASQQIWSTKCYHYSSCVHSGCMLWGLSWLAGSPLPAALPLFLKWVILLLFFVTFVK